MTIYAMAAVIPMSAVIIFSKHNPGGSMTEQQEVQQDVGASVPVLAIVATVVAVAVLAFGFYLYRVMSADTDYGDLVIATGPDTGAYYALGGALSRVLEDSGAFGAVQTLGTDGSADNMRLIGSGDSGVDLAFVQGDAAPTTNARLIATLYDEVLHIVVSKAAASDIRSVYDLQGRRVALGAEGSGTRELSTRVLRHFGVSVGEDLILSPQQTAGALAEGSIDAAFLLTAIPSRLVSSLAARDQIRFLSLGGAEEQGDEAHALELVFPGIQRDIIPRSSYIRLPVKPVHTISVTAMLVARADVEEDVVREITAILFGNRSGESGLEGRELVVARKIREDYDPASVIIPYHAGAKAYYLREQPPFFVEYAEALSLAVTLLLGLYSIFIAMREWLRRRMKNRVDAYLLEVESLVSHTQQFDVEALLAQRLALERLRRAAFDDLIAERLQADEAFLILQNHLRDELAAIDTQIREGSTED